MPDLTIKPNSGTGNKVIIQDQAGGAVLTTADSGATLGNSTQDNITRLGTVTSGTLGSGVTQRAGVTIQTKFVSYSTQYAITSSIAATGLHDSITITSGNKIKINITYALRTYANGSNSWISVNTYLYKSTNGSSYTSMHTQGWASHYRDHKDNSQDHIYHDGVYPINWLDASPGHTTVHYKLYAKVSGSGGTYSGWMSADSYYPCTIMLEELQA